MQGSHPTAKAARCPTGGHPSPGWFGLIWERCFPLAGAWGLESSVAPECADRAGGSVGPVLWRPAAGSCAPVPTRAPLPRWPPATAGGTEHMTHDGDSAIDALELAQRGGVYADGIAVGPPHRPVVRHLDGDPAYLQHSMRSYPPRRGCRLCGRDLAEFWRLRRTFAFIQSRFFRQRRVALGSGRRC
eukprot:gene17578-biopygen2339